MHMFKVDQDEKQTLSQLYDRRRYYIDLHRDLSF